MVYIKSFFAAWKFWLGYCVFAIALGLLVGWVEGWPWRDSWWFGMVTAPTLGYGDVSPTTFLGRILTVPLIIGGIYLLATIVVNAVHAKDAWTDGEQRKMFSYLLSILDDLSQVLRRLERLEKRAKDAAKPEPAAESEQDTDQERSSSWLDVLRIPRRGTPPMWDDNPRQGSLGRTEHASSASPAEDTRQARKARQQVRDVARARGVGQPPARRPSRVDDASYAPSPFVVGATPGIAYGGMTPSAPDCSPSTDSYSSPSYSSSSDSSSSSSYSSSSDSGSSSSSDSGGGCS